MRLNTLFVSALAIVCLLPVPAQAQSRGSAITARRGMFDVQPFGGFFVSQKFAEGPFGTSITPANTSVYGVEAGFPLTPNASLRGTFAYATGNMDVGLPIFGGVSVGDIETYLYDASVELRMSQTAGRRFVPFAQLGAGAAHRVVTVAGVHAKATDLEVSGGVGADIPVMRNISVRLMAKDYWGKADFGSIGDFDVATDDLHTLAFTTGVRVAF